MHSTVSVELVFIESVLRPKKPFSAQLNLNASAHDIDVSLNATERLHEKARVES